MHNLVEAAFQENVQRNPDGVFVVHADGRQVTFAEAAKRVAGTIKTLDELGLKPGDRVVCYIEVPDPYLYFLLACTHAGVVQVPLGPSFSPEMVEETFLGAEATMVFTTVEHAPATLARGLRTLVYPRHGEVPPGALAIGAPVEDTGTALEILRGTASRHGLEDPYVFLSTSGSTGKPKLVVRDYRAHYYSAETFARAFHAEGTTGRYLVVAAWTHAFGQGYLAAALISGGTLVCTSDLDTRASLAEVRALKPNFIGCAARVLASFVKQHQETGRTGNLFEATPTVLRTSGAAADPQLLEMLAAQGVDVGEIYGASEAAIFIATPPGGWRRGFVGKPCKGVEARLASDGELLVRLAGRMKGYYKDEEQTRTVFTEDGYFITGDLAELVDGYVRLVGRKKDVFNTIEGTNIHPARIELLIESLPGIKQGVLVGDQRPHLSAILVVDAPMAVPEGDLGYLAPAKHEDLYERVRGILKEMNASLESIERVQRFFLFSAPMSSELYQSVGALAKRKVVRQAIGKTYAAFIDRCYDGSAPAV